MRHNSPQLPPPEAVNATPSPLPRLSTVPALQGVEQYTPAILIKQERTFAIAGQTPLPTTPQVTGAFVLAIAPPVLGRPSGNVGGLSFARRLEAPAPIGACSPDCRIVAEGSDIRSAYRLPSLKSDLDLIKIWWRPLNDAPLQSQNRTDTGTVRM